MDVKISDDELIKGVLKYNKKYGELLFIKYNGIIFGYIYSKTRNHDLSKDLLQTTFLKAYLNLKNLKDISKFKYWLYAIARNCVFNHYLENHNDVDFNEVEPFIGKNSSDNVIEQELQNDVVKAIEYLSPQQKNVIELRVFSDLKFNEIAQQLNITENNAKVTYHSALKKLKDVLEG